MKKTIFILLIACTTCIKMQAQFDPMFTQYMHNELFINPAYAGSRDCLTASALYRNQWVGIEGSPKTQTFSMHAPINKKRIGLGMSLLHETIGVSDRFAVYGDFAYRIIMPEDRVFSMGLQGGIVSIKENYSKVFTIQSNDNQFLFDSQRKLFPNAGFGLYYRTPKFYAGLSIPRLIENKLSVSSAQTIASNVANAKDWHYYFTTGYVFTLTELVKLKPSVMVKTVKGAPIELDINANFIFNESLWLGAAYRSGDAVAALLGLRLNNQLWIGYSYDYTLTELQKFNSGSHEISISYDFSFDKNRIVTPRYF